MAHVHHFAYGPLTPLVAYGVSVLGSMLGLICTSRARTTGSTRRRVLWLLLAAGAIGGTGIWLMHFMAMLGFEVVGSDIRFQVGLTVLSAAIAVVVVGAGLFIVGTGKARLYRIALGGLVTGLGVAGMHYTGMEAMRVEGTLSYRPTYVVLSVLIAVVAATVALWFTVVTKRTWGIIGASLIMGLAVCGMHYVGMAAAQVRLHPEMGAISGVDVTSVLPVIALLAGIAVAVLLYAVLSAPPEGPDPLLAGLPPNLNPNFSQPVEVPQPAEVRQFTPRSEARAKRKDRKPVKQP